MNIEATLDALHKLRSKYSSQRVKPEWFSSASEEEQAKYIITQKEYYDAIVTSIKAVKAIKTLKSARDNINDALNTIDEGE